MNRIIEVLRQEPTKIIEVSPSVIRGKNGEPLQVRVSNDILQARYANQDENSWIDVFNFRYLDIQNLKYTNKEISDLGYIYNGFAAINTNLCAEGWRLPFDTEWIEMIQAHSQITSDHLMIQGAQYWETAVGINEFNMSVKGSGSRYDTFYDIMLYAAFWLTNNLGEYIMDWINPGYNAGDIYAENPDVGGSVRLIRAEAYAAPNGTIVPEAYTGNDGKKYDGVVVNNRLWLKDNLAETKYKDGTLIPVIEDDMQWSAAVSDARCAYNNEELKAVMIVKNIINHQFLSEAAYQYLKENNLLDEFSTLYYTPEA